MNMTFKLPPEYAASLKLTWESHILDVRASMADPVIGKTWPKPVIVFAMKSDINIGYYLAMMSGLNHRIPHRLWAERVVGSQTPFIINSGTRTGNEHEAGPITLAELSRDYEPYWLGEHPDSLFHKGPLSSIALFVYPENYMVPAQEREFVSELYARTDVDEAVIITKSAVLMGEFQNTWIVIV